MRNSTPASTSSSSFLRAGGGSSSDDDIDCAPDAPPRGLSGGDVVCPGSTIDTRFVDRGCPLPLGGRTRSAHDLRSGVGALIADRGGDLAEASGVDGASVGSAGGGLGCSGGG